MFQLIDGEEQAVRYAGTIQDVTENRKLRDALAASESRLQLAVDGGRLAVWEVDVRTDTLVGSPELYRLFGFPEGAHPDLTEIRTGYLPGERERVRRIGLERFARGERFVEAEFRYRWRSGELRWLLLRAEVHTDENGPTKVLGVLIDITKRHRVEDALRASETRLKLAQKGRQHRRAGVGSGNRERGLVARGLQPARTRSSRRRGRSACRVDGGSVPGGSRLCRCHRTAGDARWRRLYVRLPDHPPRYRRIALDPFARHGGGPR